MDDGHLLPLTSYVGGFFISIFMISIPFLVAFYDYNHKLPDRLLVSSNTELCTAAELEILL